MAQCPRGSAGGTPVTFLVPLTMYGVICISLSLFSRKEPRDAVVLIVIGGLLFLPMYSYNVPGLQVYNKTIAVAISVLIGETVSGSRRLIPLARSPLDLPMLLWCFISPFATSLSNGLGLYDGFSNMVMNFLTWGVFYWAGRRYFGDAASLRKLTLAIVAGGLIYLPLMAFEVRMSPQLSRIVYGFFPHSFLQHMRYGGFRPIVFMQHGLMVALWSAVSAVTAYWLWRSREVPQFKNIPMALIAIMLITGTVFCKSVGAMILMTFGIAMFSIFNKSKSPKPFTVMLILPAMYIVARIANLVPLTAIEPLLERYFDAERVQSAFTRLVEEDLFGARALLRPYVGWGGYRRGWPTDPDTGLMLLGMIDALWTMLFSTFGLLGLVSAFASLGIGPWMVMKEIAARKKGGFDYAGPVVIDAVVLSLILIIYIFDCLLNAMHNPVYVVCAGALVSYSMNLREERITSRAEATTATVWPSTELA